GAVGVALALWHRHLEKPRVSPEASGAWERPDRRTDSAGSTDRRTPRYADGMSGSFLGPRFTERDVQTFLETHGYPARRIEPCAPASGSIWTSTAPTCSSWPTCCRRGACRSPRTLTRCGASRS